MGVLVRGQFYMRVLGLLQCPQISLHDNPLLRFPNKVLIIKTTSFTPPSMIKLYLYECNLITLGRVNEVVLIVLTSVMDQKLIKSKYLLF
jgi:hypothetical protein